MKAKFYDIAKRRSIESDVVGKTVKVRENSNVFFFRGKTEDGRPLLTMVSKKTYEDAVDVPEVAAN